MTRYLVETTTWIDYSKGIEPPRSRLDALIENPRHEIGVCDVIVAEFMSGVAPVDRPAWERRFESLVYWEIPLDAAVLAGVDRYDFARGGRHLRTPDVLIAATARGATPETPDANGDLPMVEGAHPGAPRARGACAPP